MALLIQPNNSTFNFNGVEVKVYGTYQEPWFKGLDIANILGYSNARKAVRDHVDEEDKKAEQLNTDVTERNVPSHPKNRKSQVFLLISEAGMYSLVLRSKLHVAIIFKKWVCNVLKTIRLTGSYKLEQKNTDLQTKNTLLQREKLYLTINLTQASNRISQLEEDKNEILQKRLSTDVQNSQRVDLTTLNNDNILNPVYTTVAKQIDLYFAGRYRRGFKQSIGKLVPFFITPLGKNEVDTFQIYTGNKILVIKVNRYALKDAETIDFIVKTLFPYFDKNAPKIKMPKPLTLLKDLI